MTSSYAKAGVDIDAKSTVIQNIGKLAKTATRPEVLSGIGFFGGMFEFKGYEHPVLVSSTDSVGTKLRIANAMKKHDTVGIDIVNHCVNDILAGGAEPLFFLDYIGTGKILPGRIESIMEGLASACRDAGCALIGGETAELADMYQGEDYDLVGFVIGVVEKENIIDGSKIKPGDVLLGLPSSGLHTNGYSLVRKIFGETPADMKKRYPELKRTIGEELLEPHRCYFNQLKPHLSSIRGLAHLTGGGFIDNIPRVLPEGVSALVRCDSWEVPPLFRLIREKGKVDPVEMYRVFNMGIGMVVITSPENVQSLQNSLSGSIVIGEIIDQGDNPRVLLK